ncbi:MAG: hypothetical protein QXJ28_02320 [Candidatus Pacearchaeota archaeon]
MIREDNVREIIEENQNLQIHSPTSRFTDSVASDTFKDLIKHHEFFRNILSKYVLYDIGSPYPKIPADFVRAFNIPVFFMVDPFMNVSVVEKIINSNILIKDEFSRIAIKKQDGLSFLVDQEDNSGNVMTNAIDYKIISNDKYLYNLAQHIYRVVPDDGIYISRFSYELELYARDIFSFTNKYGFTKIFSKCKL